MPRNDSAFFTDRHLAASIFVIIRSTLSIFSSKGKIMPRTRSNEKPRNVMT